MCAVVCATTIFPFQLFLSLKAKYRWKNPHFILITDELLLYFYIAKSVYYILSQVQQNIVASELLAQRQNISAQSYKSLLATLICPLGTGDFASGNLLHAG